MSTAIGFYVHHHGSGHLTRASEIARACTSPVVGFSTLPAPPDWPGRWVVLPDDAAPAADDADPRAGGVLHWAPVGDHPYPRRMRLLAAALVEADLALLLVDVSVEVTLFARLLGIPVAVTAMRGQRTDLPHRLAYDVARVLLAPWPAHLAEPGLPAADKTVHVGGISRFDGRSAASEPRSHPAGQGEPRRVFVLWGHGGGDWPEHTWAAARASAPGWQWEHGAPREQVWERLLAADVVVTHAGQNAVAEVAAARRPAVVVALPRPHGEQAATVAALRRAELAEPVDVSGGSDVSDSSDVSGSPATSDTSGAVGIDWPAVLERAAERGGGRWSQWSDGHGAHRAASALEAAARGRRLAAHTAVVTLVHGRHDHLRGLIAGLARGTHLPERLVVVAMDDPEVAAVCADASTGTGLAVEVIAVEGTPEGLPLAHARNRGADRAAELGCDVLVFLDVDCIPGPDLVACYADHVRASTQAQDAVDGDDGDQDCGAPPTVWSGPVTYLPPAPDDGYDLDRLADLADPHPARPAPAGGQVVPAEDLDLFWSLSFALSRRDFVRIGGFCEEYVGYGGEDTDFAMRLRVCDGRLFWLGGADAFHQHHPTQRPPVAHLSDIVRNANIFGRRWGRHPMEGWLDAFAEAGLARYDAEADAWLVTGGATS